MGTYFQSAFRLAFVSVATAITFVACAPSRHLETAPKLNCSAVTRSKRFSDDWKCSSASRKRALINRIILNSPHQIRVLKHRPVKLPDTIADKGSGTVGTIDYSRASLHNTGDATGEFDLPTQDSHGRLHDFVWRVDGEYVEYFGVLEGSFKSRPAYALWHLPASVRSELPRMKEVHSVNDLPNDIADGTFVPRFGPPREETWKLAEPGAPWEPTDVITDASLPRRRLILAGCTVKVCVVYYESGGIARTEHLVAFVQKEGRYAAVWHAFGPRLANFDQIRTLLSGPPKRWTEATEATDYY